MPRRTRGLARHPEAGAWLSEPSRAGSLLDSAVR
jgi:hypothetical protein